MSATMVIQYAGGLASAARLVFWLAALALVYVYAGYPLLLALIGVFVRRQRPEPGILPEDLCADCRLQ